MDGHFEFLQQLREKRQALAEEREKQKSEQYEMEKELATELEKKQKERLESRAKLLDNISSMTALYQRSSSLLNLDSSTTCLKSQNVLANKVIQHEPQSSTPTNQLPVLSISYPDNSLSSFNPKSSELELELINKIHLVGTKLENEKFKELQEKELEKAKRNKKLTERMHSIQFGSSLKPEFGRGFDVASKRLSLVDAYSQSRAVTSSSNQHTISESEFYGADFSNKDTSSAQGIDTIRELENLSLKKQVHGRKTGNQAINAVFVNALSHKAPIMEENEDVEKPEQPSVPLPAPAPSSPEKSMKPGLPMAREVVDDIFDPVLKDRIGVTVFKIDTLQPVEIDESEYGCFNLGDCYIVLDSARSDDALHSIVVSIFIWIGPEAAPDKRFCASMFSTVLRSFLDSSCRIAHEIPHEESPEFKRLFAVGAADASDPDIPSSLDDPSTISSLHESEYNSAPEDNNWVTYGDAKDATESALYKVAERVYTTKLYEIFGERELRLRLVERSPLALQSQSVFLLDAGKSMFQWNGASSRLQHRVKALMLLENINKNERHGLSVIEQVAQDSESDLFFDTLMSGGESVELDANARALANAPLQLFVAPVHVNELSDTADSHLVTSAFLLSFQLLKRSGVFIIDCGTELFLWAGKESKVPVREIGRELLIKVVGSKPRPKWTCVTRLAEGSESEVFKMRFVDWPATKAALSRKDVPLERAAVPRPSSTIKANVQSLYEPPVVVPLSSSFLETKEQMESLNKLLTNMSVFSFERSKFRKIDDDKARFLSAKESRVFFCVYALPSNSSNDSLSDSRAASQHEAVVYFWTGRQSSVIAWAHFQLSLKQELEELCSNLYSAHVRIVRVEEGKEPLALVSHMQGWLVILTDYIKSYFKPDSAPNRLLFHIQTDTRFRTTRFAQVDCKIRSLVSRDCCLYVSDSKAVLWVGKGVSRDERVHAESRVASLLATLAPSADSDFAVVEEKQNPANFYKELADGAAVELVYGKGSEYHFVKPSRFFRCHCQTGDFAVDEIVYWNQSDLWEDVCVIFDLGPPFPIYLWIGRHCSDVVCKLSRKAVQVYLDHLSDGRSLDPKEGDFMKWIHGTSSKKKGSAQTNKEGDVIYIFQSQEPLAFTSFFLAWDSNFFNERNIEPENSFLRAQKEIV